MQHVHNNSMVHARNGIEMFTKHGRAEIHGALKKSYEARFQSRHPAALETDTNLLPTAA